jgi:hypothetical protein
MHSETALADSGEDDNSINEARTSSFLSIYRPTSPKHSTDSSSSVSRRTTHQADRLTQNHLVSLITSLCHIQKEATALRVSLQQKKRALNRLRTTVANKDEALMAVVRESTISGRHIEFQDLLPVYEACQEARDAVGLVEDEYEKMDLNLDQLEFRLSRKGEMISKLQRQLDYEAATESSESDDGRSHISFETSSSVDQPETATGSTLRLDTNDSALETVLDHNSMSKPPRIYNGHDFGARPPIQFLSTSRRRLRSYSGSSDQKGLLEDSAPDLSSLSPWNLALSPGLNSEAKELDTIVDSNDIFDEQSESLSGVLLLDRTAEESWSILRDYLTRFNNKHHRINLWLLHKLRTSPAEIIRLHNAVVKESASTTDWETCALDLWEDDCSSNFPPSPPTSTDSLGPSENFHEGVSPQPWALPLIPFHADQRRLTSIDNRRCSVTSSAPAQLVDNFREICPIESSPSTLDHFG